ncbi:MAG: MFS transporter [Gluconacetobacter diazotrophicus]|nr:MFS transporter [Gluconacetobacter diazotrophicus]
MADASVGETTPRNRFPSLLLERNFALFFVAASASTLGSAVVPVALTFALLVLKYSATSIGLVLAAQTAPAVVLMLVGGVVGDRWPRRLVMIMADILRCAAQAALALLLASGHPTLPALLALAACVGIGNAFFGPAEIGLIPQIASSARLKQANSLLSISGSLSAVAGPSLGGLLVAIGSAPIAIGLNAVGYAASGICLALLRVAPAAHENKATTSFVADLRLGWVEFRRHRWLQLITAQYGLLNLVAFAPFFVLGPVLFASVPNGARLWGLVASATGVGGIAGGLLILRLRPLRPLIAFELCAALLTTPLVLLAFHIPVLPLAIGSAVFGAALAILNVMAQTTIQERIPEDVLSRVNALFSLVATGLGPIGYALCGPVAHLVGPRELLAVGSGVVLLSAAALLGSENIRNLRNAKPSEG